MSGSIADLRSCARWHLRTYTARGPYAFFTYDRQGDPDHLEPVDCFAPRLLGVAVPGGAVIGMYTPATSGAVLLAAMQGLLADQDCAKADFVHAEIDGPQLRRLTGVIRAARDVPGIKAVTVSKILHRKRPCLVPLIDRFVYEYYAGDALPGASYGASVRRFWDVLQPDLRANEEWLVPLAASFRTPDARPLSVLRAVDIVIWHHTREGCVRAGA
jgi:hypothetical protein